MSAPACMGARAARTCVRFPLLPLAWVLVLLQPASGFLLTRPPTIAKAPRLWQHTASSAPSHVGKFYFDTPVPKRARGLSMASDLAHAGGAAAKFNFAPVSDRPDELVYGAERPGTGMKEFDAPESITPEAVAEWATYVQGQGVKRVLCLLNEKELGHYQAPGYVQGLVKSGFEESKITLADMFSPGAADKAAAAFAAAKSSGEKLVAHCAGGEGRTGVVLAQYMMMEDPSLSAQDAIDKVVGCAAAKGAIRKGAGPKIEKFVKDRTLA